MSEIERCGICGKPTRSGDHHSTRIDWYQSIFQNYHDKCWERTVNKHLKEYPKEKRNNHFDGVKYLVIKIPSRFGIHFKPRFTQSSKEKDRHE